MTEKLSIENHDRYRSGMTYVYPVVSRRAGGVSIGINLNPNNACNWRCIYCQVPGLTRGAAPELDLAQLRQEFRSFLQQVLDGDFMQQHVEPEFRQLRDVAFSGNGEPTHSPQFAAAVELVLEEMAELAPTVKLVLITNGSQIGQPAVDGALQRLFSRSAEVWFKLDRATRSGMATVNDTHLDPETVLQRLVRCAQLGPTRVQTCWFRLDGELPSDQEITAYVDLIGRAHRQAALAGILLYSVARPSWQAEAPRISRLTTAEFSALATPLRALGLEVHINP